MMDNMMMNMKVDELREIKKIISDLESKVKAIEGDLKSELDSRQVDSIDTGLHRIFYSAYEKANVDTDKLKKSGLYDQYKKVSTIIQFKITDVTA